MRTSLPCPVTYIAVCCLLDHLQGGGEAEVRGGGALARGGYYGQEGVQVAPQVEPLCTIVHREGEKAAGALQSSFQVSPGL